MKEFKATYRVCRYFNGGMREYEITKMIKARTINSARNKASKLEQFGAKARTTYILKDVAQV